MNQNWDYCKAKCLVEIWADEEIQLQLLAIKVELAEYMAEQFAAKLKDKCKYHETA